MNRNIIIIIGIIGLLALTGCSSSFADCYSVCKNLHKDNESLWYEEGEGVIIFTNPTKELKEICYNECKPMFNIIEDKEA